MVRILNRSTVYHYYFTHNTVIGDPPERFAHRCQSINQSLCDCLGSQVAHPGVDCFRLSQIAFWISFCAYVQSLSFLLLFVGFLLFSWLILCRLGSTVLIFLLLNKTGLSKTRSRRNYCTCIIMVWFNYFTIIR